MNEDRPAKPDTWGIVLANRRSLRRSLRMIGLLYLAVLAGCSAALGWCAYLHEPGLVIAWAAAAVLLAAAMCATWSLTRFLWGYTWWLESQLQRASRFPPVLLTRPSGALPAWMYRLRSARRRSRRERASR